MTKTGGEKRELGFDVSVFGFLGFMLLLALLLLIRSLIACVYA
jgi:hypothetical protein